MDDVLKATAALEVKGEIEALMMPKMPEKEK